MISYRANQRVKIEALSHVATAMVLFSRINTEAVLRVAETPPSRPRMVFVLIF